MIKQTLLSIAILLLSMSAYGEWGPNQYDRGRQALAAILKDPKVVKLIGSGPGIREITSKSTYYELHVEEKGKYVIHTGGCVLPVSLRVAEKQRFPRRVEPQVHRVGKLDCPRGTRFSNTHNDSPYNDQVNVILKALGDRAELEKIFWQDHRELERVKIVPDTQDPVEVIVGFTNCSTRVRVRKNKAKAVYPGHRVCEKKFKDGLMTYTSLFPADHLVNKRKPLSEHLIYTLGKADSAFVRKHLKKSSFSIIRKKMPLFSFKCEKDEDCILNIRGPWAKEDKLSVKLSKDNNAKISFSLVGDKGFSIAKEMYDALGGSEKKGDHNRAYFVMRNGSKVISLGYGDNNRITISCRNKKRRAKYSCSVRASRRMAMQGKEIYGK